MKNPKLILMGLVSILIFDSIKSMEDPRDLSENQAAEDVMECDKINDERMNASEKNFNKRKRDNSDDVVLANKQLEKFQETICGLDIETKKALLVRLKRSYKRLKSEVSSIENDNQNIEVVNQDSALLRLPPEMLVYIFEYCLAIPEIILNDVSNSVKHSCKNRAYIICVCKQFYAYGKDLNKEARNQYFNQILKFIVDKYIVSSKKLEEREMLYTRPTGISDDIVALLNAGADCNMIFEYNGKSHVLKDLIFVKCFWSDYVATICGAKMADTNTQDINGNTLLMRMIIGGDFTWGISREWRTRASILLEHFSAEDYNLRNNDGNNILMLYLEKTWRLDLMDLIVRKMDLSAINKDGDNVLMIFIKYHCNKTDFVSSLSRFCPLVKHYININAQNNEGYTALMLLGLHNCYSFRQGFNEVASCGANFEIKNNQGQTVYDLVKEHRKPLVRKLREEFKGHKKS